MPRKRLIWQIYPPFLLIILIALLTATWVFSRALDKFHIQETRHDLEARVQLAIPQIHLPLQNGQLGDLDTLCKTLGKQANTRFTVILQNGRVVGDSDEYPDRMDNHADRPEIIEALLGRLGVATRYSHTLQQNMMYVALPVISNQKVIGCMRAALPLKNLTRAMETALYPVVNSGLVIALLAALLSLWLSRRFSRPLEEMKHGAARFAQGDLHGRLPDYKSEEMAGLAEAMNQMASQLDDRIRTVVRQRNEQEAVLTSMVEGVLAIDRQEKILRINQAAGTLLDINPETAVGRSLREVIRKPDLQKFTSRALESQANIEADMTLLYQGEERSLQAHGTALNDAQGQQIGALVVFHDVTRLRRLESLRRDFVANVSHELKTPITAIKGAVETLLGGGDEIPSEYQGFLEIAVRQADRLNAIIDDLLALSRLEQTADTAEIELQPANLISILEAARQACTTAAATREIEVRLFCSEQLIARVAAPLLEQALINLVDNAIKYSNPHGVVILEGWQEDTRVKIKVQDRGQGIAAEHLPRLFERFYRVDAARSRAVGGTGLGLAIVKHIVQAHKGEVTVHSTPGEGSIFTISLPIR